MRISDWGSDVCPSVLDARARDRVVHTVQGAQKGRLAAARRADEGGDEVGADVDRHVLDRLLVAIEDVDPFGLHLGIGDSEIVLGHGHIAWFTSVFRTCCEDRWPVRRSEERRVGKEGVSTGRSRWGGY